MGKTVSISFEADRIKIVRASLKGRGLSVDSTEIIPDSDLEAYLRTDKTAEYIVTCDFRGAHHGILTAPAVKPGYLSKVIEAKIRKESGEKDFTFIFSPLGERVAENRKELEFFYYAVNNADLKALAGRFYDNGKKIKSLCPSVFAVTSLFEPGQEGETMGVYGTGNERMVFLTKNGSVSFIRQYESHEKGLTDYDIQNINMTLTYCFQNLRMSPKAILLMGGLSASQDIGSLPPAPMSGLSKSDRIHCSTEIYNEFILPLAACFAPGSSNILCREFRNVNLLKNYIAYASMLFTVSAVFCAGLIFNEVNDIAGKRNLVEAAMKNMTDLETLYSGYTAKAEEINRYRPAITFLNRPVPDIYKLLTAIGGIDAGELKFDSIKAHTDTGNSLIVEINGTSSAGTYSSLQASMKKLIDELGKTENLTVTNRSMDLTNKTFRININYGTK